MAKTTEQWMAEALAEMKQAQWPPEKWCAAIRDGYPPGTPYNYPATHNYKAQVAMWNAAHPAAPNPTPPSPSPASGFGQRCIYMSEVTQEAIDRLVALCHIAPHGWYTILFSADINQSVPGGAYYVTDDQLAQLKAYAVLASWCDGTATPISAAKQMAASRGLAFASGQYETVPQWNAMKQTVNLGIGNPAEFIGKPEMAEVKAFPAPGRALIGEMLHPDPGYSAQGVNISSVCVYIDMDADQGGYNPLVNFDGIPAGFKPTASLYTGGRASDADFALYWQWTKP